MPAQHYLITTVCHQRDRRFLDGSTASAVTSKLQEHSLWEGSRLLSWVLMPDHLHMLIELGGMQIAFRTDPTGQVRYGAQRQSGGRPLGQCLDAGIP